MITGVVSYCEKKTCFEHQRTGRCSCKRKKSGINPCDAAMDLADRWMAGTATVTEVTDWLKKHRCRDAACNHRPCITVDQLLEQLAAKVAA